MMLAGYVESLSSFDLEIPSTFQYRIKNSSSTFQAAKALVIEASKTAKQAVLVRQNGDLALGEELAQKAAGSLAQRYLISFHLSHN